MSENQLGRLTPVLSVICRADRFQITIRIRVADRRLAEWPSLGRAPERHNQLAIRTAHNRWKRAVKLVIFVDDNIFKFLDIRRCLAQHGNDTHGQNQNKSHVLSMLDVRSSRQGKTSATLSRTVN